MLVTPEDNSLSKSTDKPTGSLAQELNSGTNNNQPDSTNSSENSNLVDQSSQPDKTPVKDSPLSEFSSTEDVLNSSPADDVSIKESLPQSLSTKLPPKRPKVLKNLAVAIVALVIVGGLCFGAYYIGKNHQKVIIKPPPTQPINLPPQAVVLTNCVVGRGKQYIIPKDIPNGPIYDVLNSKVIAVEYNLNIDQLFQNSDTFSNAILSVTKNYPVNHLSVEPATANAAAATNAAQPKPPTAPLNQTQAQQSGSSLQDIHLIMFMVSKSEANSITCADNGNQPVIN